MSDVSAPPGVSRPGRRRRLLRALAVALVALVAVAILLQVAATWWVRTRLHAVLNRRPERLVVEYEELTWTPLRGARAKNLRMRGQTRRTQWQLVVDEATCDLGLVALSRKVLHFDDVDARGISLRLRARPAGPEPGSADAPPIEGLADPPVPPSPPPPRRPPGVKRWTYVFTDARARDVRDVWIGPYRLEALDEASVGEVRSRVREELHVEGATLRASAGRLLTGDVLVADELDVAASVEIVGYDRAGDPPGKMLEHASGRLSGSASLRELVLPGARFAKLKWLGFGGARGQLRMDVGLEEGEIASGSRFDLSAQELTVLGLGFRVAGAADVAGRVESEGGARAGSVEAKLATYALSTESGTAPLLQGEDLRLHVATSDVALLEPLGTHVVEVEMPAARIADMGALDALIPAGVPLSVVSGSGTVSGRMRSTETQSSGEARVVLADVDMTYARARVRGDVDVDAKLPSIDPQAMRFDLSGTRVRLDDFVVGGGVARERPWTGTIDLPRGTLAAGEARSFDGHVDAVLADMRPVIALLEATRGLPPFAGKVLSARDVRASADLATRPDVIELRDLRLTGDGLQAEGCLLKRGASQRGFFWLDSGLVSLGLRFAGGERHVKPFAGRKWLAEHGDACDGR